MDRTAGSPDSSCAILNKGSFVIATVLLSNVLLAGSMASAEPAAPGADFTAPVTLKGLGKTQVVVTSITIDLPDSGIVVVNSGGYVVFNDHPSSVQCGITKAINVSHEPQIFAQGTNDPNAKRMPVATTRGFRETDAGPKTYNFVCDANVGTVDLVDIVLTAVYVPKRY